VGDTGKELMHSRGNTTELSDLLPVIYPRLPTQKLRLRTP